MGLSGVAITDHECLSAHMEANQLAKEFQTTHPDFTVALGNEIYLTETRESGQKYYHFILIAKDELGHKALRELSSKAWYNIYVDRGLERVPTLKSELIEIVHKYPGHLIATSACIGGELPQSLLGLAHSQTWEEKKHYSDKIKNFLSLCKELFHDDFYIECAPSSQNEQITINKLLQKIAKIYNIKMTVGTDAHYLEAKDRWVHKSYLNSKGGEREVDSFYEFAHLMTPEECYTLLERSFDNDYIEEIFNNTQEIQKKITFYSLERKQIIPKVDIEEKYWESALPSQFSALVNLQKEGNSQERFWLYNCLKQLQKINKWNDLYLDRLNIEATILKTIGDKLNDCLFAYFNTFQHYIHLFWECGSIVGPGRGSATGFLSNYLLGITQLDPIRWDLKYWRFLNLERAELPNYHIKQF